VLEVHVGAIPWARHHSEPGDSSSLLLGTIE
jgi:hypothetical protein